MKREKAKVTHTTQQGLDSAWRVWLCATGVVAVSLAGVFALGGRGALGRCMQTQPLEIVGQAHVCAALVWLTFGLALALLRRPNIRAQHGLTIICSAVLLFFYINFLRERFHYGDVLDYVRAAFNLYRNEPFHGRYLYPPLLATLCQPFVWAGVGERVLAGGFWGLNWAGLVLFFVLLARSLQAYGFDRNMAHCSALLFMLVNVPVLRTLCYVQVNFLMMSLILFSFLAYSRSKLLSAAALALAVHLKASPIILALPFLSAWDIKWLIRFGAALAALFALTFCFYGWPPFASFLANTQNIYSANGILFRECSIDAVVRTVALSLRTDGTPWVWLVKLPVLAGLLWGVSYSIRQKPWTARGDIAGNILEGLPPLLFVMVLASPLVWEHHFVFLALPALLLLKKMRTASEWVLYGFAYLLIFLMPTFDFFPLSFCRLAGAGLLFYLCVKAATHHDTDGFAALSQRLEQPLLNGKPPCFNG